MNSKNSFIVLYPDRHHYHNQNKKEAVKWPHIYFELPTLEDSMAETSQTSTSASFGGVASNTVRPFNNSFIWTSTQDYVDYEHWDEEDYDNGQVTSH